MTLPHVKVRTSKLISFVSLTKSKCLTALITLVIKRSLFSYITFFFTRQVSPWELLLEAGTVFRACATFFGYFYIMNIMFLHA